MSHPNISTVWNSSDHDFIAALRFLDDYGKQVYQRSHQNQSYHRFVPKFDLEQHADTYELYGEVPGFRRENILIEAHDDSSLQISGSISPLNAQGSTTQLAPEPAPAPASAGTKKHVEETGPKTESAKNSSDPVAVSTPQKPLSNGKPRKTIPTTNQERYLIARFGDVLDPNATFHDNNNDDDDTDDATNKGEEFGRVHYLLAERHPSAFHRAFHFPTPIRRDEIVATVTDGVLHVTAPRAAMREPPRRIYVRSDGRAEEVIYSSS